MPKSRKLSTPDEVRMAEQAAILETDEQFAARWVTAMRKLVAEGLDRDEFTRARMAALAMWTKDRKLEQSRINYRYNLGRRNHALVSRDVDEQLESIRKKLKTVMAEMDRRSGRTTDADDR